MNYLKTRKNQIIEKLAEELFKYPLEILNSRQLRKIPHYQMVERELCRDWINEYAEVQLYNIKAHSICDPNSLEDDHGRYSTARAELWVARDLSKAEPHDLELPDKYKLTAGHEMVSGKHLFQKEREMDSRTFEDLTKVINRWILELGLKSEFKWVNTNQIL